MGISDCKMAPTTLRDVLRFAAMALGAQYVMTSGLLLLPMLPADSWDSETRVSMYCSIVPLKDNSHGDPNT